MIAARFWVFLLFLMAPMLGGCISGETTPQAPAGDTRALQFPNQDFSGCELFATTVVDSMAQESTELPPEWRFDSFEPVRLQFIIIDCKRFAMIDMERENVRFLFEVIYGPESPPKCQPYGDGDEYAHLVSGGWVNEADIARVLSKNFSIPIELLQINRLTNDNIDAPIIFDWEFTVGERNELEFESSSEQISPQNSGRTTYYWPSEVGIALWDFSSEVVSTSSGVFSAHGTLYPPHRTAAGSPEWIGYATSEEIDIDGKIWNFEDFQCNRKL
jgi:hypothetical protein